MFKVISIIIVVVIIGVLGFATTKPDSFRIERTTKIKASPEKIYTLLGDFKNWGFWSPWEKMDPNMKRTFSGAATGKGSIYEWDGNSKVGQGRMEIGESSPQKISIKLDFIKPFEGHNTAEFTMQKDGEYTTLTWAMFGPSPYLSKVMQVFCNMDSMVGKDFETGLTNLKTLAEK
jgi:hypothetical protein